MLIHTCKDMDHKESQYMIATVELDDTSFGAKIKGGRAAGNQGMIVCVSKDSKGLPQFLIKTVVPNVQRLTVERFMDTTIEKGTTNQTDSYRSYIKLLRKGTNHESSDFVPNSEHL